ncbi:MAG: metallophosphoesterase, partial [Clostridia bacterium]|nr:metallophosphoesterase [Clostridia bacterium]
MSLFTIADLHLSLGTDKPMDVFSGWDNYVEKLSENWRKIITDDDTVVIAGDISWAMKLSETEKDFEFINNLPGNKILLKGNHD